MPVDYDAQFETLLLDLNYDDVPAAHRNRYDLTTNCGTTEHVVNQMNSFRIIHDMTKPGGFMLHDLPWSGMYNHGLFNYKPHLLPGCARATFTVGWGCGWGGRATTGRRCRTTSWRRATTATQFETGTPFLVRFMIDAAQQGRGTGRQAVARLEEELRAAGCDALETSFVPVEGGAEGFWRRCGFSDTGRRSHGEPLFRRDLRAATQRPASTTS